MILIDDVLISDEILQEEFVCNLDKCKGGCCVDGDAGAPLLKNELSTLKRVYPKVKKYLSEQAIKEIEKVGIYTQDEDFEYVTPDINKGVCVYGYEDDKGVVKCAIEKAYNNGEVSFKKPISCHLFPIRVTKKDNFEAWNYEPRQILCSAACKLGKELAVPVYVFLKDAIIRAKGEDFYKALDTIAREGMLE